MSELYTARCNVCVYKTCYKLGGSSNLFIVISVSELDFIVFVCAERGTLLSFLVQC